MGGEQPVGFRASFRPARLLRVGSTGPRWACPVPCRKRAERGVVAGIDEMDVLPPAPIEGQAMRTEFGRPRSSMRLRTWTATSTSVARRSSACERRASPITRLKRDMAVSARARLV